MKFKATEDQVKIMAANAISASRPMGMGYLHYKPGEIAASAVHLTGFGVEVDYYQGRMVKLYIARLEDGLWEFRGFKAPHPEYQSWCAKYPSYEELLGSAGISLQ